MKKLVRCLLLGVLIGDFLLPPTVQAQFTVFDPAQYSLQIERQIEEAARSIDVSRDVTVVGLSSASSWWLMVGGKRLRTATVGSGIVAGLQVSTAISSFFC